MLTYYTKWRVHAATVNASRIKNWGILLRFTHLDQSHAENSEWTTFSPLTPRLTPSFSPHSPTIVFPQRSIGLPSVDAYALLHYLDLPRYSDLPLEEKNASRKHMKHNYFTVESKATVTRAWLGTCSSATWQVLGTCKSVTLPSGAERYPKTDPIIRGIVHTKESKATCRYIGKYVCRHREFIPTMFWTVNVHIYSLPSASSYVCR